jgi:hypothetical protein
MSSYSDFAKFMPIIEDNKNSFPSDLSQSEPSDPQKYKKFTNRVI